MKKGYTLLEVLVAIVIATSSIIAVFQIFSMGFSNFSKVHTYQDMYLALTNLMEDLNARYDFEKTKTMQGTIGSFGYEWQASPAAAPQRMSTFTGEPGPYDITLYKIVLKISAQAGSNAGLSREYAFYKTGWKYAQK